MVLLAPFATGFAVDEGATHEMIVERFGADDLVYGVSNQSWIKVHAVVKSETPLAAPRTTLSGVGIGVGLLRSFRAFVGIRLRRLVASFRIGRGVRADGITHGFGGRGDSLEGTGDRGG